ncbi:MAG: hypothetical protein AAGA48_01965 [Myxococcota bacterium]
MWGMRWGLMALVVGCGRLDGESWPAQAADATCDFSRSCAEANFFTQYDNINDCRADNEASLQAEADDNADCEFNQTAARACIDALKGSCRTAGEEAKTLFEPCQIVWDCADVRRPLDRDTTDSGI